MKNIIASIMDVQEASEGAINSMFLMLMNAGGVIVRIAITVLIAYIIIRVANSAIDRVVLKRRPDHPHLLDDRKAKTLSSLLRSIVRYVVYAFAIIAVLRQIGIDTTGLLAGAGLAGLAIGFGAQSLVRDVINGFFILFEDHFAVGDYVTIGDVSGVVESVGLRVTRLRSFGGELYIIPNGLIERVVNHMGSSMRVLFGVTVTYGTDIDHVIRVLNADFEQAKEEIPDIVEGPSVLGVNDLGDSGVELRIVARAKPMKQWGVERALKKRVKEVFDREGIQIPYRRMQVYVSSEDEPRKEYDAS
ncbi:MAG TPA: mechanosensitive ion channel protein MscS [Firmicutes bacterium]|nr:mechanosensitive ion channel protein MscS [Bacillota bacterium]